MQSPDSPKDDLVHSEAFLHSLMRRQLRLSVFCAGLFLVILIGLPLLNYHFPERMAERVLGGFTVSWFLLGIGVFPAVWWIAWFFIRRSIAMEREEVKEARRGQGGRSGMGFETSDVL